MSGPLLQIDGSDFTFQVFILFSLPIGERQLNIHASSVWSGFCEGYHCTTNTNNGKMLTHVVLMEHYRGIGVNSDSKQRSQHIQFRLFKDLWVQR